MKRPVTGALVAVAVAVAATSLTLMTPAGAALTTRCVGEGGAVTVPGDLVVPSNAACSLTGTVVDGDVRVGVGADLVTQGVTVKGRIVVGRDGYLETADTQVAGDVVLSGAFGGYLQSSTIGGRLRSAPAAGASQGGLLYLADVDVTGDLRSTADEVSLEASTVAGNLMSTDSRYTDLTNSFVDGTFTVSGSALGSVLCGTAVRGTATFSANAGALEIGTDAAAPCAGGGYWGGTVTVKDNTGGVRIDGAVVNGDVVLRGNAPVARLGQVSVRGTIRGDHEPLDDAGATARRTPAPGRTEVLRTALAERGTTAGHAAAAARIAALG